MTPVQETSYLHLPVQLTTAYAYCLGREPRINNSIPRNRERRKQLLLVSNTGTYDVEKGRERS